MLSTMFCALSIGMVCPGSYNYGYGHGCLVSHDYQCGDDTCIPEYQVCDGKEDCPGGEDEFEECSHHSGGHYGGGGGGRRTYSHGIDHHSDNIARSRSGPRTLDKDEARDELRYSPERYQLKHNSENFLKNRHGRSIVPNNNPEISLDLNEGRRGGRKIQRRAVRLDSTRKSM